MNEFQWITDYMKPLAKDSGALGLRDDAAILRPMPGIEQVISSDAMVEGRHFLPDTDPEQLAKKLLAVNLSDMAAMGAEPRGYLLTTIFSGAPEEAWCKAFASGLEQMQRRYGFSLLGGDTVRIDGPMAFNVTMIGETPKGQTLQRCRAREGDDIYVSGHIGNGLFGLYAARGQLKGVGDTEIEALKLHHYLPTPQVELGRKLMESGVACAMDISDGLVADLQHICNASNVSATIRKELVPFSKTVSHILKYNPACFGDAISGGDDYELIFTVPRHFRTNIENVSKSLNIPLTIIGRMEAVKEEPKVEVLDEANEPAELAVAGFAHF